MNFYFLFLIVIHVDIHSHIAAIFEREIKIKAKKPYFHSILLYKPLLKSVENLFLLCLLKDAHLGLVLAKFQVIAVIFKQEIKKKAKKAHFYSILLYKPIPKSLKNLFLLCLLIDAHLGLVLAKFQVIAAIFEGEI